MSSSTYRAERARYAALTRSRSTDDPVLVASRYLLQAHALLDAINQALKKAPPMTEELRLQIIGLIPLVEDVIA